MAAAVAVVALTAIAGSFEKPPSGMSCRWRNSRTASRESPRASPALNTLSRMSSLIVIRVIYDLKGAPGGAAKLV
jgi:hypothetical protein